VHASSLAGLAALTRTGVRVASPDAAALHRLAAEHWTGRWREVPERPGTLEVDDVDAPSVGRAAFAAGVELHELTPTTVGLEDVFLRLTGGADDAPDASHAGAGRGTGTVAA
jgi:ABC-2 type transport system ATP-binding protein